MPAIHRISAGDANNAGGVLTTQAQGSVYANTKLVSVNGSIASPDAACDKNNAHCHPDTTSGCATVFAEGIPVNFAGNIDNCGHSRVGGSPNVFLCAGGGGAVADSNPPINPYGGIAGGSLPPAPPGAQYEQHPGNYTIADHHAMEQNDDPDGPLGGSPPNTIEKPVEEKEEDQTPPPPNPPPVQDCSTVDSLPTSFTWYSGSPLPPSFVDWAQAFQISPNYTVADLTVFTAVSRYEFSTSPSQASATQKTILQNLCYHAKTVLEPLLADSNIPPMTITSAFRNKTGGSQHNRGQATDIQFLSLHGTANTGRAYYELAQYIRDNFNYDQLILEWFGRNPWIHISSNSSGHRNAVLTQISSNGYTPGLKLLG